LLDPSKRVEILTQVTVLVGDDGRGAAEDQITGEERLFLLQVKTEVVGGMTRRMYRDQRRPVTGDELSVAKIRDAVGQARVLEDHLGDREARKPLPERHHAADVIAMAVRQHDRLRTSPAAPFQ